MKNQDELDISSEPSFGGSKRAGHGESKPKPFIGVHFSCCNIYTRAYRDETTRSYIGRCPKCFASVKFVEGSGGRSETFYRTE